MQWRLQTLDEWHIVFAWLPRITDDAIVWLERLERRRQTGVMGAEYRRLRRCELYEFNHGRHMDLPCRQCGGGRLRSPAH
jgi:hypothetical protein